MYIEFRLPSEQAGFSNMILNNALHEWSDKYDIPYNTKIVKFTKRITFDKDEHYSLFAMTWNRNQAWSVLDRWRIVSDLNNKSSFDDVV